MQLELALQDLSDVDLLTELSKLARTERAATARLVAALAEVDARRLYLSQGCASLFVYCTRVLHLSEHAAYGRIEAARAARRFPVLLEMLDAGDLTLTSVSLLAPHLDDTNHRDVLGRATHRSKREVEEIVAALRPKADVPTSIRKVTVPTGSAPVGVPQPARSVPVREGQAFSVTRVESCKDVVVSSQAALPSPAPTTASRPAASVHPLSPERYKLQLTISGRTREKLRRAQDLLRHSVPSGDIASVLDRALDLLLEDLERLKFAETSRPHRLAHMRPGSRHIPAAVRRAVWRRDGGACSFRREGRRCGESAFLEFHHVRPYADGGPATVDNIELRCRAHNQYEAELFFGEAFTVREGSPLYRTSSVWTESDVSCIGA